MNRSEQINELVAALAEAQKKFDPVLKESTNPAYRGSKYADLSSVIHATQPHLAAVGLVVMQFNITSVAEQQAGCTTMLAHKSGQFIEETYMLPAVMQGNRFDAQSCGSAFTYARRYAWQAIVGVAAEVDDDGNAAAGVGTKEAAQAVAAQKVADFKVKALSKEEPKGVIISRPEALNGHYIAVSGMIEAPMMAKFFSDTESKRFQSVDGKPYWRVPSEYEKDLLTLCTQLQLKVTG